MTAAGHGCGWSGNRLVGTDLGGRLRHRSHRATRDGDWHTLTVHLHDPETGLVAEVTYRSPNGIPVLRSEVTLRNAGQTTLHLESVSLLAVGCLTLRIRRPSTPRTCCGRRTTGSPNAAGSYSRCA